MNPKSTSRNSVGDRRGATSTRSRVESDNEDIDESGLSDEDDEQAEGGDAADVECDLGTSDEEEGDSSDMDVNECEKKRFEYIDDLTDLEKQFAILREQLYRERLTQIEAKLTEVKAGRAAEYLQPLEDLQINMKNRMEVGGVLRELRLANIQCKFEAEKLAAEQNFQSEKELLFDVIKADLEEKIRKLEEDKNNVDFSTGLWEETVMTLGTSRKRKLDPLDPDRRKKPVSVSGPYIVYMLNESDILDDWSLIKKSLQQQRGK